MVFLLHNHPMSYISLVLCWVNVTATSVNCESEISQHNKFCPSKANALLLYSSTLVYINHHLQALRVLINSRRHYHTNISLSNSKPKTIQKALTHTCTQTWDVHVLLLAFCPGCVGCVAII